ncbi:MAG TPA: biotin-dependent carboxyltransferase family protein [Mucilaginibacter sp.]|jgi:antagonist of KipI|nr:biotin-dependent carboxyltransferase family protein [Mucilaginibacter sp.]
MKIRIKRAGLMTTIQDLGRFNYLSQGVPVSGAMDRLSAQIANIALGNDPNDAVIEFTQSGASFIIEEDALICLSGDGASLKAGVARLPSHRPLFVPSGTPIYLENLALGYRTYLAVAGGWDVPEVLGSKSTYLTAKIGGLNGRSLKENNILKSTGKFTIAATTIWDAVKSDSINYPKWSIARNLFLPANRKIIRVVRSREFEWFDKPSTDNFLSFQYTLGHNSNRMGYQLRGPILKRAVEGELLSTAVAPGTIQVTHNGELVLLMADCQTTGGYPRIAQVLAVDLPLCAQLTPGDVINFKEIDWRQAEKLYIEQQAELRKLACTIEQLYT